MLRAPRPALFFPLVEVRSGQPRPAGIKPLHEDFGGCSLNHIYIVQGQTIYLTGRGRVAYVSRMVGSSFFSLGFIENG